MTDRELLNTFHSFDKFLDRISAKDIIITVPKNVAEQDIQNIFHPQYCGGAAEKFEDDIIAMFIYGYTYHFQHIK